MGALDHLSDLPETVHEDFLRLRHIGFARYANEFAEAADLIPLRPRFSPVPYLLYSRSIELSFKAFLLFHRVPVSDLAGEKFGHNLMRLSARASKFGLGKIVVLTSKQRAALHKAHIYYNKKGFEYYNALAQLLGRKNLPNLQVLAEAAHLLANSIGQYVARHRPVV